MNVRRPTAAVAAAVLAAVCAAGCADSSSAPSGASSGSDRAPRLKVTGAYVPRPPLADMATGYFTVTNSGRTADRLTAVSSDLSPMVSMHTTTDSDAMKPVTSLPIPAGGTLRLRTGGNHLMLMNLKRRPAVGDTVTFTLTFAHSAPITVNAPVEPATYQPED